MNNNNKNKLVPRLRFPEFKNSGAWQLKKLWEIGDFFNGGTPDTKNEDYWNGDILWFTPSEIKKKYLKESNRKITELGLKNSSAKLLPKGSILITTRATIGDVGIALEECTTNQGFQSLVVKQNNSNEFWYYYIFNSKSELDKRASGSTFKEITKSKIISIPVLAPSLPEQQKIASCLSSIDEVITGEQQKLELLKQHKKGLLQNLFPQEGETVPKIRFKEFENSGEWEVKKLGEICEINPSISKLPKEFIYIDLESVKDGQLFQTKKISIDNAPSRAQRLLRKNDIIFQMVRPYQRNNLLFNLDGFNYVASTGYAQLRTSQSPEFLYYQLHTDFFVFRVLEKCTGTNYPAINTEELTKIEVFVPSLPEQQKIASCLSSLDDLITAQTQKIEQLQRHKKGLLQGLFPNMNEQHG
ncbi:restriction endonuclease [Schleiferia thermophila str. Yellowstone]|uniref:restriction endonuclease subunit S n=1 Tax=Schleiferia thermophila TaxID=884107 RepID=UPI0004E77442|nr:restriction endonuclease subunit S [Schleiferia thermophila]KFD40034.1 restriction endonuclease [Schleiferia thermophila str. Yellowstone]